MAGSVVVAVIFLLELSILSMVEKQTLFPLTEKAGYCLTFGEWTLQVYLLIQGS